MISDIPGKKLAEFGKLFSLRNARERKISGGGEKDRENTKVPKVEIPINYFTTPDMKIHQTPSCTTPDCIITHYTHLVTQVFIVPHLTATAALTTSHAVVFSYTYSPFETSATIPAREYCYEYVSLSNSGTVKLFLELPTAIVFLGEILRPNSTKSSAKSTRKELCLRSRKFLVRVPLGVYLSPHKNHSIHLKFFKCSGRHQNPLWPYDKV